MVVESNLNSKHGGGAVKKNKGSSKWNLGMKKRIKMDELMALMYELECLQKQCDENYNESTTKDEFKTKQDILLLMIGRTKAAIQERHMQKAASHSLSANVIRSGRVIDSQIQELEREFKELKDIYTKQKPVTQLHSAESMEKKFSDLQVILLQIEDCKSLMKDDSISMKNLSERCDFTAMMAMTDVAPPGELKEWREPTAQEAQQIEAWANRDAKFDEMIFGVGDAVDRLGQIAKDMNEKAIKQQEMAMDITQQAEQANQDLTQLNVKVQDFINTGSDGSFFVIRLFLIIALMVQIAWLISVIVNKMH